MILRHFVSIGVPEAPITDAPEHARRVNVDVTGSRQRQIDGYFT